MTKSVVVIGGTGLLGYHTVQELLRKGYGVTSLSLPPIPVADLFPAQVENLLEDINEISDAQLSEIFTGKRIIIVSDDHVFPLYGQKNPTA